MPGPKDNSKTCGTMDRSLTLVKPTRHKKNTRALVFKYINGLMTVIFVHAAFFSKNRNGNAPKLTRDQEWSRFWTNLGCNFVFENQDLFFNGPENSSYFWHQLNTPRKVRNQEKKWGKKEEKRKDPGTFKCGSWTTCWPWFNSPEKDGNFWCPFLLVG